MQSLAEEQPRSVSMKKLLDEAAFQRMELTKKHYDEVEREKMVLDKVQTTYETKFLHYEEQAKANATFFKKMKDLKQTVEDSTKLGVDWIRRMVTIWRDRTKANMDACSATMWTQWSQQAVELQILQADAENKKKADVNLYKMDEASIVTIREEVSDDFFSLVESHLEVICKLVERLDDNKLGTQLQFERYERER